MAHDNEIGRPDIMKIWCLLSWFDERPDWLTAMIESVAPLVDGVVAVDGPYPLVPYRSDTSGCEQYDAIIQTCKAHGLDLYFHTPGALSEVDKRAFMFKVALEVAEPLRDWFLIMDGDMYAHGCDPQKARHEISQTDHHAAEITFHNLDPTIDGNPKVRPFRSLFRAIPGLTVEGLHSLYTVPDFNGERLIMWQPIGRHQPVPALDLTEHVHLYHRPHERDPARQALRANYYDRRATANIEHIPEYIKE